MLSNAWYPTVDGRNPAPVEVGSLLPLLTGFYTSQVVQNFFHQQYVYYKKASFISEMSFFKHPPLDSHPQTTTAWFPRRQGMMIALGRGSEAFPRKNRWPRTEAKFQVSGLGLGSPQLGDEFVAPNCHLKVFWISKDESHWSSDRCEEWTKYLFLSNSKTGDPQGCGGFFYPKVLIWKVRFSRLNLLFMGQFGWRRENIEVNRVYTVDV